MESTKSCMGTILGEEQEVEKPPDDLDSEEKLVWEDILSNSVVPVNSDFNEALESKTHEFAREVTADLQAEQNTQADTSSDWEAEVSEVFDNDIASSGTDSDLEDWDAESDGHDTDLATVEEIVDNSQDDEQNHDYFIEPKNERELEMEHSTRQQLAIPYNQSIGHRRPRGVEIRRMRERKRTKIHAKLLKGA